MKHFNPTTLEKDFTPTLILTSITVLFLAYLFSPASSQTRQRTVSSGSRAAQSESANAEVVKVDVDLVTVDALVLQKNTARVVGGLKKGDFVLFEDGVKQEITHFGQDNLPLSVLLLIDRGGCLDPFGAHVHKAALDAVSRFEADGRSCSHDLSRHSDITTGVYP